MGCGGIQPYDSWQVRLHVQTGQDYFTICPQLEALRQLAPTSWREVRA